MNNPQLYHNSNKLQQRGAKQCFAECEKKLKWNKVEREQVDTGCGDGCVTTEILKSLSPEDFERLYGIDIDKKMVNFSKHNGHERICFEVQDIIGNLPKCIEENFYNVFSFYTLHWIPDQECAFSNIYKLLADDVDCLLMFPSHMTNYDLFRALAEQPRWQCRLSDLESFLSSYHDSQESQDPEEAIKVLTNKIGFQNIDVQIKQKCYTFHSLEDCKNAKKAQNIFVMSEKHEEFLNDYFQQVRQMQLIDRVNNNIGSDINININYTIIVVYATKNKRSIGYPNPTLNNNLSQQKKALEITDAELYQQSNELQKRDAKECLQEYEKKIRWKSFERVLDIGCGDGGVTTEILKRFITNDFAALVGTDISARMVNYANDHHGDSRTRFQVMDITRNLPPDFKNYFSHVFSFYTLHWVRDQEQAFSNIYNLLADDGECLHIFLGYMPYYDVLRTLKKQSKYCQWLKDLESFVSPYHDSQDPEKDIRSLMTRIGFRNIDIQIKHKGYTFHSLESVRNAVKAVNPFKMPQNVEEDFLDDYIKQVRDLQLIEEFNNNTINIHSNYDLIVVYARKEALSPNSSRVLRHSYDSHNISSYELYYQSKLQQRDAEECLKQYKKKFKWKRSVRVLDIGSGNGRVTEILKNFIPRSFEKFIGSDTSVKIVSFANGHNSNKRMSFVVMDIVWDLTPDYKNYFHHVFSFYTFYWFRDQERALSNIYNLVSKNGVCLLVFLGHMPLYDAFRAIAEQPRWRFWLSDIERFFSPYHDLKEPEPVIRNLMSEIGFRDVEVEIKRLSTTVYRTAEAQ